MTGQLQHSQKINCLVVDDELPAQEILKKFISSIDSLHLSGVCSNAIEALNLLQHHPIDLLFLDIQMPQLTGTEFIRSLKMPPKVIFTTAYNNYAVEAFELEAVDYLVKPIPFTRFVKAVNKVLSLTTATLVENPVSRQANYPEDQLPFMYFRSDRKMFKVYLKDILYMESMKDYLKVITTTGQIITKQALSSLQEMLPEGEFIRIHRSYIISQNKIQSYSQEKVQINNIELPIGKIYRLEVSRQLNALS
jgi:two-component system, LytTR family, response regulator